ncbi:TetR/AcrR family transcriptional regulator [Parasphingopyxis marina]|nr:TetR/AcrR family transcriptional regulator [Parasphingopyxis marina]
MSRHGKRPTGTIVDWRKRRGEIAAGALALYLERPWPNVGIEEIAERLGISYWQVYYSFDGQEDVYKAAVDRLIDRLARRIAEAPASCTSVNRTIHAYVRHAAAIVGSEDYARLVFLAMRDEHTDLWVKAAYEKKIAIPLRQGLEIAVKHAGRKAGLDMIVLHGASERYLTMLETALALPRLLRRDAFADGNFEKTIAETAKEVWSATCTFDGFGTDPGSAQAAA